MATKVWKVDNQLRIEIDGVTTYGNAAWYAISDFTDTTVTLMYHGRSNVLLDITINFTDFQDDAEVPYATEDAIADYLAPLIG
jgi:hypothetical protein